MIQTWSRQGSATKPYTITLREDGRLSCDCRGWTTKKAGKGRTCKHTKEIGDLFTAIDARDDGEYVVDGSTTPVKTVTTSTTPPVAPQSSIGFYRALMLASTLPDDKEFEDYCNDEWAMEEKYDGQRCLVHIDGGIVTAYSRAGRDSKGNSRDGLKRDLAPQIVDALQDLPDGDYDGEIIVKGEGMSSDVSRLDMRANTMLVIFDLLSYFGTDTTYQNYDERRGNLENAAVILDSDYVAISISETPNFERLQEIWATGGEGVVLKRRSSIYTGSRSSDWVKIKQHDELVADIIGFEDSKINGQKDAIILYAFDHPTMGRIESKCKVLNADWSRRIAAGDIKVGTQIEVSYQILLPSGKPRHGMAKRIVGEA